MLTAGALVHGRYRIVRQVGRGGMGAVYEAEDTRLRCQVALKEMRATGGQAAAAFEHEAQLLASLRHPALPVVMDYFMEADGQFLVMQFIPGEDLGSALAKREAGFGLADLLAWLDPLCAALEFLHGHRPPILHRDIKPANLKLTPRGEIILLDFGLAKGTVRGGDPAWDPSVLGYTPRYSPLEQVDGSGTDARSDLYALGATVYHLLTGVPPPNALERATALLNRQPDPMREAHVVSAGVPEAVSAVLARALAIGRDDRFESAHAMRSAFLGAVAGPAGAAGKPRPETRSRRIDAAAPSQAQIGTRIDLLVQVRFPDSPRLGLEDWPSRRRPSAVEQVSEVVRLAFPIDPVTGEPAPARLHVKVIAPDFVVEGQATQLIDVPPDAYSQRVSFLLTATRAGLCRLNVEVYAADAVFLGSVPVETEVGGEAIDDPRLRVSNLHLSVVGRDAAGVSPTSDVTATAPTRVSSTPFGACIAAPQAAGEGDEARTVPTGAPPPPALGAARPPLPPAPSRPVARWVPDGGPPDGATFPPPAPPLSPAAGSAALPQVGAGRPGTGSGTLPPPAPASPPRMEVAHTAMPAAPRLGRLTRILAPAAAVTLAVAAGVVYFANASRLGLQAPEMATQTAVPADPAPAGSAPASPPQAIPPGAPPPETEIPRPAPPATTAPSPVPPPAEPARPVPVPTEPTARPTPPTAPPVELSPKPDRMPIGSVMKPPLPLTVRVGDATVSFTHHDVSLRVVSAQRRNDGALVLQLLFNNAGPRETTVGFDYSASDGFDPAVGLVGISGLGGEASFGAVIPSRGKVLHTIVVATGTAAFKRLKLSLLKSTSDASTAAFQPFYLVLE